MVPAETNDLREDAYTCPIYAVNCTAESAIYVMELTVVVGMPATNESCQLQYFFIRMRIVNFFRSIMHNKFPIIIQSVILIISSKIFDRL